MYIFSVFDYPYLWSQFVRDGLFFIILLLIQIVVLIYATKKRNPYTWIILYAMEAAEFLITFGLSSEDGKLGEVAHVAMWLYFAMILITISTHLVRVKRIWAAAYVLECAVIGLSVIGIYTGDFLAACMAIAFITLLIGTIVIHRNLKRNI